MRYKRVRVLRDNRQRFYGDAGMLVMRHDRTRVYRVMVTVWFTVVPVRRHGGRVENGHAGFAKKEERASPRWPSIWLSLPRLRNIRFC